MCEQTLKAKAGILIHKLSDHLLSFINIDLRFTALKPKHMFIKKSSDENYLSFRQELQQENLIDHINLEYNTLGWVPFGWMESGMDYLRAERLRCWHAVQAKTT